MNLTRRLCLATGLFALVLYTQYALRAHLESTAVGTYPELRHDLESLPRILPVAREPAAAAPAGSPEHVWQGADNPGAEALRKILPFKPDAMLCRYYRALRGGPPLHLYLVYSRLGEDRHHHPEVCIREVQGTPEDLRARTKIYFNAEKTRAAQRFRFRTGTNEFATVYYWHYTIEPVPDRQLSGLQRLHQQLSQPTPSITVQMMSPANIPDLEPAETILLPALDAALQNEILPDTALIGCDRLPIGLRRSE